MLSKIKNMHRIGEVRFVDDNDFARFKSMCEIHDGWKLVYNKHGVVVRTMANDVSDFNIFKVCTFLWKPMASLSTKSFCFTVVVCSHFYCTLLYKEYFHERLRNVIKCELRLFVTYIISYVVFHRFKEVIRM